MKNILLPTDYSTNAWNAIFTATKLYAPLECRFYLLHTFAPKSRNVLGFKGSLRAGSRYALPAGESEGELHKIKAYLLKHHNNKKHIFETLSLVGGLVDNIQTLIPQYDIDLIVMGTHGATGSQNVFVGSNALKVIRGIDNCATLLVPDPFNFQTLKSIAFPTEFAHFEFKKVLFPFLDLLELWKPEVHILHVAQEFQLLEQQKTNRRILMERLKGFKMVFHEVPLSSNVTDAILKFTLGLKVDLVVLTKHSQGFFEGLTREPVVKRVGVRTEIPLLVLPDFGGH